MIIRQETNDHVCVKDWHRLVETFARCLLRHFFHCDVANLSWTKTLFQGSDRPGEFHDAADGPPHCHFVTLYLDGHLIAGFDTQLTSSFDGQRNLTLGPHGADISRHV